MKKFLKSIFNYHTILSTYIGAIGYGIGYGIPLKYNLHPIICLICCLLLGSLFDRIAEIILSKDIFNSKRNKIVIALSIYVAYLVAWFLAYMLLDYDIDEEFLLSMAMIIFFQIISLIVRKIKKYFKSKRKHNNN